MNNNISYNIYENNNNNDDNNFDDLMNEIISSINIENNDILELEVDYNTNYNVKQLKFIYNFYNIETKKRNLKKQELINEIINFELNNDNKLIVNKRKQLWFYIKELKNDDYLNKFILIDI
tara:strand:+ start:38 stop:400 length:363 start_codon:yes stop_codon:yes gene_type:complete